MKSIKHWESDMADFRQHIDPSIGNFHKVSVTIPNKKSFFDYFKMETFR